MTLVPLTTALAGSLAAVYHHAACDPHLSPGHLHETLQALLLSNPATMRSEQVSTLTSTAVSGYAISADRKPGVPLLSHSIAGGDVLYHIQPGDNVAALASRFGVDGDWLAQRVHLYPRLDANLYTRPLPVGSALEIDNHYIVPANLKNGILVSIAQRRVCVLRGGHMVKSYPAAVGDPEWQTPVGRFQVIKMLDPGRYASLWRKSR